MPSLSIQAACDPLTWRDRAGAFSYAIADEDAEVYALVRDHFGLAPLYYFFDGHCLIVGSNLPDVIRHLPVPAVLDTSALLSTLTWSPEYSDQTYYQQIKRVDPGCILYFSPNQPPRKIPFWVLDPNANDLIFLHEDDYLSGFILIHRMPHRWGAS